MQTVKTSKPKASSQTTCLRFFLFTKIFGGGLHGKKASQYERSRRVFGNRPEPDTEVDFNGRDTVD